MWYAGNILLSKSAIPSKKEWHSPIYLLLVENIFPSMQSIPQMSHALYFASHLITAEYIFKSLLKYFKRFFFSWSHNNLWSKSAKYRKIHGRKLKAEANTIVISVNFLSEVKKIESAGIIPYKQSHSFSFMVNLSHVKSVIFKIPSLYPSILGYFHLGSLHLSDVTQTTL